MLNVSHYKIFAIGKVKKKWIQSGIEVYLNRLPGLKVVEIKDSNQKKEGLAIKEMLKKNDTLITLSEHGQSFTSQELAQKLQNCKHHNLSFAIGGPTGLSPELCISASWQLSLSPLTFTHEIARLLLIEQIYRAQTILQGGPYHKH
tara:strand:- start:237 stop:674 length:438 start_codon:yes stop_codon:yes gene_type:complete